MRRDALAVRVVHDEPLQRRKTYTEYGAKVRYSTPAGHDEQKATQAIARAKRYETAKRKLAAAQAVAPKPKTVTSDNVRPMKRVAR